MKKIKKLLLATDFSEDSYNAYLYALHLIAEMKVHVEVLHVIPTLFEPIGLPLVDSLSMKTALGDAVLQMKSFIQKGISEVESNGINYYEKIQTNIEIGNPVKTIGRIVKRDQIDLIIVGRRGQNNNNMNSLGSVSLSLLNDLRSDIFIIPSGAKYKAIKKIGFATACQKDDPYLIWKAKEIFQREDIEFKYIHIANENNVTGAKANVRQIASYCKDNLTDIEVEFSTIKSDKIAQSLVSFTKEKELDALVLFQREKRIFQKIFSKSTAKEVIKLSENPILILKGDENHL